MLNEPENPLNRITEAEAASGVPLQGKARRTGAGDRSSRGHLPRVLLLASDLFSVHRLRVGVRQAGLSLVFECVTNGEDFLRGIQAQPHIAVCCLHRLQTITLSAPASNENEAESAGPEAIASLLQAHSIPMVLIGGDHADERALLEQLSGQFYASLRRSQLERLPTVIERALLEQQTGREQARIKGEAEQLAHVLRDSQKLLTVGRLAGEIAHEINNPLEAVTNLLYLMSLDSDLTQGTREYLETAQQELERVVVISKQTLNFYRETQLPQRVQLADLLDEVLVLYARKLEIKKIKVTRQYRSQDLVTVFPGEMRQIFANLVANAIDALPYEGCLSVRIHAARKWSDSGVRGLRFTFSDNGSGMTEEVRRNLGRAFFTTKGTRGTGLGLWVSKAIVQRYGGDLQLRSSVAPGRSGTTFSIFLPTNLRPQIVEPPPGARQPVVEQYPVKRTLEGVSLSASADESEMKTLRFQA
jgi:two-component system NtrC family sensor kinase